MANKQTIKDLLANEIKDLYSAEKQLTKAIPKMAKGSHDAALKAAFQDHLEETKGQVSRLEEAVKVLRAVDFGPYVAIRLTPTALKVFYTRITGKPYHTAHITDTNRR